MSNPTICPYVDALGFTCYNCRDARHTWHKHKYCACGVCATLTMGQTPPSSLLTLVLASICCDWNNQAHTLPFWPYVALVPSSALVVLIRWTCHSSSRICLWGHAHGSWSPENVCILWPDRHMRHSPALHAPTGQMLEIGLRGQRMFTHNLGYLSFVYIHMFQANWAPLVAAWVFSPLLGLE